MTASLPSPPALEACDLTVGYGDRPVIEHLDVRIEPGSFTILIGPNACGKSTLLKAFSRLLAPSAGHCRLGEADVASLPSREVATQLAYLPQVQLAPSGITVVDLVARGRHPHQNLLHRWSDADDDAVTEAMHLCGITDLAERIVDELSGGQRQRVWIAMILAQQTPLLLLDEPTTYLDIANQVEVLELCRRLHREGRTLVAVIHDLNQAARYATHLIAMRDGQIVATGSPQEVVTAQAVEDIFGVSVQVIADPASGTPLVVPAWEA